MAVVPNKGRRIRRFPVEGAATYLEGAPVLLDGSGEIIEAGADPATILGFAASDAVALDDAVDPDPGFKLVFVAYPDSTFLMEGTADPVAANVGIAYDMDVDGDGVAEVDTASVVAARLLVEDFYIRGDGPGGLFEVSVLGANRQFQV